MSLGFVWVWIFWFWGGFFVIGLHCTGLICFANYLGNLLTIFTLKTSDPKGVAVLNCLSNRQCCLFSRLIGLRCCDCTKELHFQPFEV